MTVPEVIVTLGTVMLLAASTVCVPPPNWRAPLAVPWKVAPLSVPPFSRLSMPAVSVTVPVLLKGTATCARLPPVSVRVPELLTALVPPDKPKALLATVTWRL